jgi:TRAP-type mannitol/chloroaromatic compound transport system permease large subunit
MQTFNFAAAGAAGAAGAVVAAGAAGAAGAAVAAGAQATSNIAAVITTDNKTVNFLAIQFLLLLRIRLFGSVFTQPLIKYSDIHASMQGVLY